MAVPPEPTGSYPQRGARRNAVPLNVHEYAAPGTLARVRWRSVATTGWPVATLIGTVTSTFGKPVLNVNEPIPVIFRFAPEIAVEIASTRIEPTYAVVVPETEK